MNAPCHTRKTRAATLACLLAALTLSLACVAPCAVAQSTDSSRTQEKSNPQIYRPEVYRTLYFSNLTQPNDLNDVLTDMRNMLPRARLYGMPSQGAVSIYASAEDVELAQKILADLDRARRLYRLTYTINETDAGKPSGTQSFTIIVASGGKSSFKQGSRVPIVTGVSGDPATGTQVQYQDVGLNIDASVDGYSDGLKLRSRVEQTSVAEEKSGVGTQDPIVRQTMLDGASSLEPGKPLVLGSLDIPGTTRKQEIEVVGQLVK